MNFEHKMQRRIPIPPLPHHGDTKSKLKFAYLPHAIGPVRVWLERYEVLYAYQVQTITCVIEDKEVKFDVGGWLKLSERVLPKHG